jgi:hypothetical protein
LIKFASQRMRSPLRLIEARKPADCSSLRYSAEAYWTDSSGRRNTLELEVAMSIRKRRSARSGRGTLASPGRPPVAGRDEQRSFWRAIAAGQSSEGHPTSDVQVHNKGAPRAILVIDGARRDCASQGAGHSIREIGRRLGRSASTISRELRRNAATRSGGLEYRIADAASLAVAYVDSRHQQDPCLRLRLVRDRITEVTCPAQSDNLCSGMYPNIPACRLKTWRARSCA